MSADGQETKPLADGSAPGGGETTREKVPAPRVDRRTKTDRRDAPDRRQQSVPVAHDRRSGTDRRAEAERRTPGRRGGEYELDAETLDFIRAINAFKEASGKLFPTWSDILGVLKSLGWERTGPRDS